MQRAAASSVALKTISGSPVMTNGRRGGANARVSFRGRRARRGLTVTAGMAATQEDLRVVDFYELMGIRDDATTRMIKKAYHELAKCCHPDIAGDDGHNMCVLLNEAYGILIDIHARALYDAELIQQREDDEDGFTGLAYSKWSKKAPPGETRAVFVDEFACIGCKQCVWAAPAVFRMDNEYGRSRVFAQWLNEEDDIQCAIESCPVDCIHWVERDQLPYLEHVTQSYDKVSVGIMMSGQGMGRVPDPFEAAATYQKTRDIKMKERAARLEAERRAVQQAQDSMSSQQRRRYRKAADRVKETWEDSTGVAFERMRRRRWADAGATVPIERALVPLGYWDDAAVA